MYCHVCDKETPVQVEFGEGGVEKRCAKCEALFREQSVSAPEPAAARPKQKRTTTRDASEPLDVVKEAKKRLRFVKREIKKLRKLEKEQAQLERLLAAAETPVAAVTPIRRARNTK